MKLDQLTFSGWPRHLLLGCGFMLICWSLATMTGWYLHERFLMLHTGWFEPIAFNSAFLFFLSGLSLTAFYCRLYLISRWLGYIILLFALATIVLRYFDWNHSIDNLFTLFYSETLEKKPFRMAYNTVVCFCLLGVILSFGLRRIMGIRALLMGTLAAVTLALSNLVLVGRFCGVELAYSWMNKEGMALASATAFMLICTTLLAYLWMGIKVRGAQVKSLWITIPLNAYLAVLIIGMAVALWQEQKVNMKIAETTEGMDVREDFLWDLKKIEDSLHHMVGVWIASNGTPRPLWDEEAKILAMQSQSLLGLVWVSAENKPTWIFDKDEDFDITDKLNDRMIERAKENKQTEIGGNYNEFGNLTGISLYIPIYIGGKYDGVMVGVFDIKKLTKSVMRRERTASYKVKVAHNGDLIAGVNLEGGGQLSGISIPVNLSGLQMDIEVQTINNAMGTSESRLPEFVVLGGLIISILATLLIYYAQKAKMRQEASEEIKLELQRAHNMIIEQDRLVSLGTLIAGIAHEIKNPLNIMKSFSELSMGLVDEVSQSLDRYQDSFSEEDRDGVTEAMKTLQANLVRISEQGKRANNTIQMMLAQSHGSQEATLTDIHNLLDEYLNLSYYGIRAQDPTFNIKITKRYDAAAPRINVISEDLSRVFLNLFYNAYYALAQKQKKEGDQFIPELIITTHTFNGIFEIRIRDNGIGIPPLVREKIFTPFFTTKPHGIGTGLGLSLSRSIIADHGGKLDFVSKEGEFTEFHITMPIPKKELIIGQTPELTTAKN